MSALVFIAMKWIHSMMEFYHTDKKDDAFYAIGGMFTFILANFATEGLIFYTATFPLRMVWRIL